MSIRRVRKRDGREVPFEKGKIRAAVLAAQTAVGEDDPAFAGEVGELVELALRRRYAWTGHIPPGERGIFTTPEAEAEPTAVEAIPDIEEIQDLVEIGLIELGHARVAKAYILYRDRRTRARESSSADPETPRREGALRGVRVREAEGIFPWSKSRIVAALVHEADLSRSQAEEVAARVEVRVVSSGLKRISTALIRELVDNELVASGLSGALARQAPVAMPRYDLRNLLRVGPASFIPDRIASGSDCIAERGIGGVLGGELLRRYALTDVFDERFAELHFAGDFHLEDLRSPHLHLTQTVPCDLLVRGTPGSRAAFDILGEVAALCGSVSRGVVLEAPAPLLQPLARSARREIGAWLAALSAVARGAGRRIDLSGLTSRATPFTVRLITELADQVTGANPAHLPRLFIDGGELELLLEDQEEARPSVEILIGSGHLIPTWSRSGELFVGPGCRRRGRERGALACGGVVALNLARLANRAGPWREDLVLESLANLVEVAVDALVQLSRFQRELRNTRSGEARGRVAYALAPVGLAEALRLLGDGEVRPEQGARLLGLVSDASRRFAAERGLSVVLTPFFSGEASRRFARLDSNTRRDRQGLLFAAAGWTDTSRGGASRGYHLDPRPGSPPGTDHAALLATVPVGPWLPPEDAAGPGLPPALESWEGFHVSRTASRASSPSLSEQEKFAPEPLLPLDSPPPRASK
jgi:hypothetical protein